MPLRSPARGAATLMLGTLASRVTGLLRSSLLVQLFDVRVTDAFNVALRLPNLFRELLAEGALTNAFVPSYKALPRAEARRLSGALLSLLLLANALLLLLATWAAPYAVGALVQPDTTLDVALTVTLTRAVFPVLSALSFSALAMGILNAEERFFAPAWAPVVLNVVTSLLMVLFPGSALMLAVAFVLGGVAQLLFQLPALARAGLLPRLCWWHPQLAPVLLLTVPFTFTTGARQLLNVVSSRLLSGLPAGSVTAFSNADLFLGLALGLCAISPALAFYSRLAAYAADPVRFRETLLSGLRLITCLSVPAGVLLSLLAGPAVRSVFDWLPALGLGGGIAPSVAALSAQALAPLGLAVFPVGLSALLLRALYVRRRVWAPVALSALFTGLNALFYALLGERFGLSGLSWATVAVGWVQVGVLGAYVWRLERFGAGSLARCALKVWLAAGLSAALVIPLLGGVSFPAGWGGAALEAGLGGAALLALYAAFCVRLGVREVQQLARWRR